MFYREEGSQVQDGHAVYADTELSPLRRAVDSRLGICIYPEALMVSKRKKRQGKKRESKREEE